MRNAIRRRSRSAPSFCCCLSKQRCAAPLSYLGGALSEDFDDPKLAKTPNGLSSAFPTALLPGWASDEANYIVEDGTTTTGALYSFGTTGASDRALGSIASGSPGPGVVFYGLELLNNTTTTFYGFTLTYTGEQWRQSTAVQNVLNFQYSLTAPLVNSPGLYRSRLHWTLPRCILHATGGIDGNLAVNRTTLSSSVSFGSATWAPGKSIVHPLAGPGRYWLRSGLGD